MATNLQIYESQVIQFLQSATIVFSPIATQQNSILASNGIAVDENDPTTWKYYLNLSGQYHSTDTVMVIQSLDTKTTVNFTPAMLASSPKTKAAYTIGSSYYNALCQTYPTQVDLIKSILYPVDLETAINAQDFTLLGWGEGYLESTEEEAIINEILAFITYASSSWYFPFLAYECYYTWTFWASLWQTLPNVIFAARIKYLRTSYVHSFHIWAYLESNGISDYSDILTRQQALFLYRNINYLVENRGTQSNLVILVNNLLDSINVGLVGKTIYMDTQIGVTTNDIVAQTISVTNNGTTLVTEFGSGVRFGVDLDTIPTGASISFHGIDDDGNSSLLSLENQVTETTASVFTTSGFYWLDPNGLSAVNVVVSGTWTGTVTIYLYGNLSLDPTSCEWTPEFVSTIIPTINSQSLTIIPPESMTQINGELIAAGFEVNNTEAYILQEQTKIGNTNLNILPTKLVEIQKLGIDQKYGSIMVDFILDTLVSMIVTDRYTTELDIVDPTTNISISISAKDALALYYYAIHRSGMEQPIELPVLYTPSCAFRYDVAIDVFPEIFSYDGFNYPTRSYLDVGAMIDGISYPSLPINDNEEFSELVSNLFLVLIKNIRYSRTEGNYISLEMFLSYMKKYVLQTEPYTFTLSTYPDYVSWANSLHLTNLFTQLEASTDYKTAYSNLATTISTALVPFDQSEVFAYFGYTPASVDNIYDRLKALFEQLCSYNIAFLDTSRVSTWWFLTERIISWMNGIDDSSSINFNPVTGYPDITITDQNYISVDPLDRVVATTVTGNVIQNLIENDMVTIGAEQDTQLIVNPFSLFPKKKNETDSTQIACPSFIYPVFVSSSSNQ